MRLLFLEHSGHRTLAVRGMEPGRLIQEAGSLRRDETHCWSEMWQVSWVKSKTAPPHTHTEGKERRKTGRPVQIIGRRGNPRGQISAPPTRISKVYREAFPGFGHIHHPHGLSNTLLSPGGVPEPALAVGTVGGTYAPRTGSTSSFILSMTSSSSCT